LPKKVRILVLSPSALPTLGGLQRYTHDLAVSLAKANHGVLLLTLEPPPNDSELPTLTRAGLSQWNSVRAGFIPKVLQKIYLARELYRHMRVFKPAEIICTWWDPWGYVAILLRPLFRVPVVSVAHGQEVIRHSGRGAARLFKRWIRSCVFRESDLVVAVSGFTQRQVRALGVADSRIKVIPNGLTSEYIEMAASAGGAHADDRKSAAYQILQVGRLVERKGHAMVLEALAHVKYSYPVSIRYVIVGSGPLELPLHRKAQELGLEGSAIFVGSVSDNELHRFYQMSDLVVMPSHNPRDPGDVEGFGIVYLEAYAHGKPVIGVQSGGVPDAVQDGVTGLLTPPGAADQLGHAILWLMQNPAEARAMGDRGRQLVLQQWRWENLCKEFLLEEPVGHSSFLR
jgi:phosphatidylinositol alpha-1,6-mannosyltransferase